MKNKLIISTIIFSAYFCWLLFFEADVIVGETVNGVTTVTCTGGCLIGPGGLFGGTKVCDSDNICVTLRGFVKEKRTQTEAK